MFIGIIRSTLLFLNPHIELSAARILKKRKDKRAKKRKIKKA